MRVAIITKRCPRCKGNKKIPRGKDFEGNIKYIDCPKCDGVGSKPTRIEK